MKNTKETSKAVIAIVLICVIGAGLLFGVNAFTAPLIEKNNASLAYAPLLAVMPEAKDFAPVYEAADASASALADVPATVVGIYEETSGAGYAVKLSTTEGYTGDTIEFAIGVSAEGKITGAEVTAYNDTKDFGADYPATYVGQDSALAEVQLVGGVTYSSSAFKNAVADAFSALIANGLVKEGVKGDDQLLMELLPALHSGLANAQGVVQAEAVEVNSGSIVSAMTAANGSGCALLCRDGDMTLMACVNLAGSVAVYDATGADVTAEHSALAGEAEAYAAGVLKAQTDAEMKKLAAFAPDGAAIEPMAIAGVFNSVTGAYKITNGDEVTYGFVARPYGYSNMPMCFYFIIDADGAIVSMNADAFILEKEYFSSYTLDVNSFKDGFAGLTAEGYNGDQAVISGATVSSNAVDTATNDCFAAFGIISENGGIN